MQVAIPDAEVFLSLHEDNPTVDQIEKACDPHLTAQTRKRSGNLSVVPYVFPDGSVLARDKNGAYELFEFEEDFAAETDRFTLE